MGLDNFATGGNTSSSSTSRTTDVVEDNSPTVHTQAFTDDPELHPRAIKYQIKSIGVKWAYSYSHLRFESGELVMYASGDDLLSPIDSEMTVMVHTTIQSIVDDSVQQENQNIWVCVWNLEQSDIDGSEWHISYEGEWKERLVHAIEQAVQELI